ncbi:uncharacterized protein CXorf49-like [Antechinus flavipes]|uniref:uncharacterized protein CXorf49-like n=1 Tax=Antechinus flavipes TaxID=38775 RepID=UPI002235DA0F|nr:uncharacterized protein CXorf49-like [Antechinus flavipes]
MQSPNNTLGYRASFAEEAKVISDQLQGQEGADVSTIEAEVPPPELASSDSFLVSAAVVEGQEQRPIDNPATPPAPEQQEPKLAITGSQNLLFLEEAPASEEAASPVDSIRWQLNVTMELCSLSPDGIQAGDPSTVTSQPSTELNQTCVLSAASPPPPETVQAEGSQTPDDGASGEGPLLTTQDLSDTPMDKTFLFSQATFVTSTPHGASGGLKLLKAAPGFSFPDSPPIREAPSLVKVEQPSSRRHGVLPAAGSPPKVTAKSGPLGKVVQEKRSLGGTSLAISRRGHQALPLPGQKRWSTVPYKASALPVLLKSRREPLAPPGPRQPKGRTMETSKMKETEPASKAGNNPPSTAKVSQLLRSKSVPPRFSLHQRGPATRDPKVKDPQVPRNLKPLAPNQSTRSRAPSRAEDQPSRQEKKSQSSLGQSCPQCLVLQKQVEDLKSQLAALQCLSGELQGHRGSVQDSPTANTGGTT